MICVSLFYCSTRTLILTGCSISQLPRNRWAALCVCESSVLISNITRFKRHVGSSPSQPTHSSANLDDFLLHFQNGSGFYHFSNLVRLIVFLMFSWFKFNRSCVWFRHGHMSLWREDFCFNYLFSVCVCFFNSLIFFFHQLCLSNCATQTKDDFVCLSSVCFCSATISSTLGHTHFSSFFHFLTISFIPIRLVALWLAKH